MHGMHTSAADAFTRGGASESLPGLTGARLITSWQLDAVAVAVLVLLAAAYMTGVALVPVRAPGTRWPARRTVFFMLGLVVVAYATNGSIAVYDQALFSAHMAGHLALVMVAPALLVAGHPLSLAIAASSPERGTRIERIARSRVVSVLTAPPVALATYALVIVGSHLSGVMNTVMRDTWAGQVEHLVYLLAGCQFFVLVIGSEPIRWRLASPARWLLLAIAMAVDTFTGIVLMQGTQPVELVRAGFSVNSLTDTHTGGAIMWFAGDALMLVVMVALVVQWLRSAGSAPAERGWLEQARGSAFSEHTEESVDTVDDEDDAARAAYNEWLGRLAERR
jgi:putative copper resistance protein D